MADAAPIEQPDYRHTPIPKIEAAEGQHILTDPTDSGRIAVTNRDGSTDTVAAEDVNTALQEGSHLATEGEYYKALHPTLTKVGAFGTGLMDVLPGGEWLAIQGAKALGGEETAEQYRSSLNIFHEAAPEYAMGGLVLGSLATLGLGGAGGAAEAGGELSGGLASRAVQRFAGALPAAAGQGAIIGAGQQLNEDALGNHEVTAEKMVASAVGGAVWGGLLGGGLAAAGGLASDVVARYGAKAASLAKTEGTAALRAEGVATKAAEQETKGGLGFLAGKAEEQAFKATGAKIGDIRKLGGTAEEIVAQERKLGRRLLDEGFITPTATPKTIEKGVRAKLLELGEDLGAMRKRLDAAPVTRPSMEAVAKRWEAEVGSKLADKLYGAEEAAPTLDFLGRAAKQGPSTSFEQFFSNLKELDEKLTKNYARIPGMPTPPGEKPLLELRRIMNEEFTAAGERASTELGDKAFTARYQTAKAAYADFSDLKKILTKETARDAANHTVSLTDNIHAALGVAGALAGHPTGLVMPALNYVRRVYGNQLAALALDKVSRLGAVQQTAANVDGVLKAGVKSFLTKSSAAPMAARATQKVTPEQVAQFRAAVQNPTALTAAVANTVKQAELHGTAPKVSQALATTLTRAAIYLGRNAPATPPPVGLAFMPQPPRAPAASDMARFQNIVDVVNDPMSVVDDLRHGRLDRDKVEALAHVYPRLYEQMRNEVRIQGAELRPQLTTQQEYALSFLFREPLSPSARPEYRDAFQATYAKAPPEQGPGAPSQGRSFNRERSSLASPMDQLEKAA